MLQLPPSWPHWMVWSVFATLLAALDLGMGLVAAMVVKTRGTEAMAGWYAAGAIMSVVLFWVVSSSLTYGDMLEMNVLWIAAVLALVPIANTALTGQLPTWRVIIGLIGMIVFVAVIQWPGADSGSAEPRTLRGGAAEVSLPPPEMRRDAVDEAEIFPRSPETGWGGLIGVEDVYR